MKNEETCDTSSKGTEPHFIELNKVLEEKVNSLMSEVDLILKKQVHIMHMPKRYPDKKQNGWASKMATGLIMELEPKNSGCELTARKEIDQDNQKIFNDDEIDWMGDNGDTAQTVQSHPTATKKSTSEAVICFFKGQITKLQTDLQAIQNEKKKMEDKCKDLEAQICKQEQNKEKLLNQQNYYRDNILKMETANSHMSSKMQAQNTQISSLQKEIEILKKKLTSLNQLSTCNEIKLNRNLDENDKLRSSLKVSQMEEKESREYIRKIQEEKRLALKASEKQRTEIFQAFKKQTQLVNNLKKQKLYLEINKEIQFMEREFTKILECKVN